MKINYGIRFRLYPNRKQMILIQQTFGCTRFVYNQALDFRQEQYANGNPIGYNETDRLLSKLKNDGDHDWLNAVDSISLQQCLRDLNSAYKNFFKKNAGFPRFKSKHDHNKSYRTQAVGKNIEVTGSRVKLPKLGYVKAGISRPLPKDAKINNATVEQVPSGKYYVVINIETELEPLPNGYGITGIDMGIKDFLIDSNGNKAANPKFLHRTEARLKKAQHKLSRMVKGSRNWNRQRIKVAKIYEHLTAQKDDFLHKLSTRLVRENQIICHEDLNVAGMMKDHSLAKSISEVSWSKFFAMLEYKAYRYGCEIITIPRFYASSQICHDCGFQYRKVRDTTIRDWICPKCGSHHDRDVNAAMNILHKGLEIRQQQLQAV